MKVLADFCKKELKSMKPIEMVICDYIMTPWGPSLLPEPINSLDHVCQFCGGKGHYTPFIEPSSSDKRGWLCENAFCEVYSDVKHLKAMSTLPIPKHAIEWPLFCELNGIGDVHHDVKFEKIQQVPAKIDYLLKFGIKPCGIIFMQGDPGTGKTYASMGVCEFFTRKNISCVFLTQSRMLSSWSEEDNRSFVSKMENVNLLVIDDFGTSQVTPAFMRFFMDLINTRLQWTNRGTIITTNLDDKKFLDFCGSPLNDRIKTGQKFEFKDKSRRKPIIL